MRMMLSKLLYLMIFFYLSKTATDINSRGAILDSSISMGNLSRMKKEKRKRRSLQTL